jgi:hypothetical protein
VDLFAIDDSRQDNPSRDGMHPLVAVGGIHVPGDAVRGLERSLDVLCAEFGFPEGDEFKWSPSRGTWQRTNLQAERREHFHLGALALARDAGATAIVMMTDTKTGPLPPTKTHEESATMMFLERAQESLPAGRHAIIVFDRPGGDRSTERRFLATTMESLRTGTTYSSLDRLALAVATDSKLSRLIQLADVVTACSTSYVAGEKTHSPRIFKDGVLPLLREDYTCRGGRGLKIHPDIRYRNLYHWLLEDEHYVRYQGGQKLPMAGHQYATSPDTA